MVIPTNRGWVALGVGAALTLTTLALCLAFASARDGASLSLRDLERSQAVLMSCAHDSPLSGAELLWCADPSSPMCLPALPASDRPDLGDAPQVFLAAVLPSAGAAAVWHWLPDYGPPMTAATPRRRDRDRLERPPRV